MDIRAPAFSLADGPRTGHLGDMPELQKDIKNMSFIVRYALSIGFPVLSIEIENNQ